MTWAWAGALVVSAFVAHWGADKLTAPLKAVRKRYGLAAAAGGALVALASASSDVAVNAVSALRGAGQIGLGNLLGSNVVSIPFVIGTAYLASRTRSLDEQGHDEHAEQGWMRVERGSVTTVALPYLALVALFAALTAVPAWRGLQPVDGVIMVVAHLAFLAQAVLRGRGEGEQVSWSTKQTWTTLGGLLALAVASIVIVTSTQQIANALGVQPLVAGLFLTAPMTALPAAFTTWAVVRSGQVTSGVTSPFGDNTVALTLGALPLAIVALPVQNYPRTWSSSRSSRSCPRPTPRSSTPTRRRTACPGRASACCSACSCCTSPPQPPSWSSPERAQGVLVLHELITLPIALGPVAIHVLV